MNVALSILPIILTFACGYAMVAAKILPRSNWGDIETLSFRLLIPVVLIRAISGSDLSISKFGAMVFSLILALTIAGFLVLILRRVISHDRLPNPSFTTLFQTTIRWNAFIALAAAELLIGPEGFVLIAVAMAILVPLINVANIIVLAMFGDGRTSIRKIVIIVFKNPLVQACLIGLAINLSGVTLPQVIDQTLDLIGRATLGVGLLAVGAGIKFRRLLKLSYAVWAGIIFRLGLCPTLFLSLAAFIDLSPTQTLAGVLVLAVPAASNGYIVAKQMGGDADLYADILAWQTVLSMLLLPLIAIFLAIP
ncbi:hypothetical protein A9Q96_16585 [Rhodobacterales bacterium 52_120_T64]|nr:hypothetical protein A9Q96_16585 [Rhodobacterales bacterium 52_120_T64]